MKTLNHRYLSRLDHLRFFAATFVILFHTKGPLLDQTGGDLKSVLAAWLNNGLSGVTLFLVMSGFLFCVISGEGSREIEYLKFVKNRLLRIFPLLTVVIFAMICVTKTTSTPEDIFRLLTLQLNTGPLTDKVFPITPMWTIAVEFQFYLLFPFLALFLHRFGVKYIALLIIMAIVIKLGIVSIKAGQYQYGNLYGTITGRIDQFLVGMVLAVFYNRIDSNRFTASKIFKLSLLPVATIALTAYFMADKSYMFKSVLGFTFEAVLWGMFVIGYLILPFKFNNIVDKVLMSLGSISFSMYLLHMPIWYALRGAKLTDYFAKDYITASLLMIIPTVIAVSYLSYNAIEKPFLSMRVKYLR